VERIRSFRKRREALLAVDEMVRDIVQALDAQQVLNNTVVVFTSDNGWLEGSHRKPGKVFLYEESIRVPLVMRGPGIPENQIRTQLVNNLDLVASLIALTGTTPGDLIDGRNLMPIISSAAAPWRSALVVHGVLQIGETGSDYEHMDAIRSKSYMYMALHSAKWGRETEFYDLNADPYELVNRVTDPKYSTVVRFFREALKSQSVCAFSTAKFGIAYSNGTVNSRVRQSV
jgi:arylsulfatase A-like enzyme